jgi:enoyl-CoA hydratase
MPDDAPILTDQPEPGVLVITINRPHRRNAFDRATSQAMEAAVDAYDEDPSLRCAILTGAGGSFCAGQDLIAAATRDIGATERRGGFGILKVPPVKPLIAAVEGDAVGGGLELCLASDLVVASREAMMGLTEVARGLVAVGGGCFRLPNRIPYHIAMELAITGRAIPATEMQRLGLVNRLSEPGHALETAVELAREVLRAGPLAVVATAQIVRASREWPDDEAWERQREFTKPATKSADAQEGIRAFAEKRTPVWTGR